MLLTKSQGERLTTVLHAARPEWATASIATILQNANRNEGLPATDFDHALRATIAYATAKNPAGTSYLKQTPGFIAEPSRFWDDTAPPHAPKPKAPPCEEHNGQDATTCACCWADIKLGQRPENMLGKRQPWAD